MSGSQISLVDAAGYVRVCMLVFKRTVKRGLPGAARRSPLGLLPVGVLAIPITGERTEPKQTQCYPY